MPTGMIEADTSGETERTRARAEPLPNLFFLVIGSFLLGATRSVPVLYVEFGVSMGWLVFAGTLSLGLALDGWRYLKQTVSLHSRTTHVLAVWCVGWCSFGVLLNVAGTALWMMYNQQTIRWT